MADDKPAPYEWLYADIDGYSRCIGLVQGNSDVMIATGDGSSVWLDFRPTAKTMILNAVNERSFRALLAENSRLTTALARQRDALQLVEESCNTLLPALLNYISLLDVIDDPSARADKEKIKALYAQTATAHDAVRAALDGEDKGNERR